VAVLRQHLASGLSWLIHFNNFVKKCQIFLAEEKNEKI
jgi:hypothetical protein